MYAEQNGRNTWNDAGAGVTQREEDTGGVEKTVAVLTAAADCRCQFTVFYVSALPRLCYRRISVAGRSNTRIIKKSFLQNNQNRQLS